MNFIFDDENVKTVRDVVSGMYASSTNGKLTATVPNEEGCAQFKGYLECEMEFTASAEKIADEVEQILSDMISLESIDDCYDYLDELLKTDDEFENMFYPFVYGRAGRVKKLHELDAPQMIIDHEEKAFAFYWVLARHCNTL